MANLALGKKIIEDWYSPEEVTNGNFQNFTGSKGFTSTHWPKNLTLDLENIYEIETIRFLLWNKDARMYKYRLLTSENAVDWIVHFDSHDGGYKGWQEFQFHEKLKMKYIRLHCMWNSMNGGFHIVELQAYDKDTEDINIILDNKRIISSKSNVIEIEHGSGLPLTEQMNSLTNTLEKILQDNQIINPGPFNKIIDSFRMQTNDIQALEKSIDSIRREIISPVKKELEEGKRLGKFSVWGFYVGFIGIIVSIFAILNGIFKWI